MTSAATARTPATKDLDGFRRSQRLAYACAQAVADTLEVGVTEKQAAAAMRQWLTSRGVTNWFHLPFAWFGDRTAFRGVRFPHQFFPTDRVLTDSMPYILDCAPVVDGYPSDIGYSGCLGDNPTLDRLLDHLAKHRCLIVDQVKKGATQGEVYQAVDDLAAAQGLDNRHRAYPFGVIAHQVQHQRPRSAGHTAFGFGVASTATLVRSAVVAAPARRSPLWNRGVLSHQPPQPGLWAVEPHLGLDAVGAKFEELLVVTDDDAYWLDDDVPHVRRWNERGLAA